MYPETEFEFARRGQAGIDVKVKDSPISRHPSTYDDNPMNWPEDFYNGDFKPGTINGYNTFIKDINSGKFHTASVFLPYNLETGESMSKTPGDDGIGIDFIE